MVALCFMGGPHHSDEYVYISVHPKALPLSFDRLQDTFSLAEQFGYSKIRGLMEIDHFGEGGDFDGYEIRISLQR